MEARANLGSVLLELGELESARREFEQVLQLAPTSAPAHLNLGQVHVLSGRIPEARAEYLRALEFETDVWPAMDPCVDALKKKDLSLWEALAIETEQGEQAFIEFETIQSARILFEWKKGTGARASARRSEQRTSDKPKKAQSPQRSR